MQHAGGEGVQHQKQGKQHAQEEQHAPWGAACSGEEQHAPGRSSMPRGGAACPGEAHAEGVACPEGVACSEKQYARGGTAKQGST